MPKFSISKLEKARLDPLAFAKLLKDPQAQPFGNSRFMDWQRAVHFYHREKDNLSAAINYLDKSLTTHFVDSKKSRDKKESYIQTLILYTESYKRLDCPFLESKKRILYTVNGLIDVAGEIPLLYMSNKGYQVFFFCNTDNMWEQELKYPFLQNYFARQVYNCSPNQVEVGIFNLETATHEYKSYSDLELEESMKELSSIGDSLSNYLKNL